LLSCQQTTQLWNACIYKFSILEFERFYRFE